MDDFYRKIIYYFENETIDLTKCLIIGPVKNLVDNDFFNYKLENIFENFNKEIFKNKYLKLKDGENYLLNYFSELEKFNGNFQRNSLDFSSLKLKDNERIYAFFLINCYEFKNTVLKLGRSNYCKIWLNNNLIYNKSSIVHDGFYEAVGFSDSIYINLTLNKGDNLIIVELNNNSPMISLKLSREEYKGKLNIFNNYYEKTCLNKISIIHENNLCVNQNKYEFMIIPRDFVNIDIKNKIEIKAIFKDKVCKSMKSEFYKKISIDTSNLINKDEDILEIQISYNNNVIIMKEKLLVLLSKRFLYSKNNEFLNYLNIIKDDIPEEMFPWFIKDEYNRVEFINSSRKILKKSGFHRIFYVSKLDNTIQNLCVLLPNKYSNNKSYSIMLHLVPSTSGNFIKFYKEDFLDDDIILIEVSTRGVTQGSYIGEAAILESIGIIKQILNLNEYSLNLIGYSTGAFAVWAFAENYPNLVNSIITISGFPYLKNLCNIKNIPILNISADNDDMFNRSFKEPSEFFNGLNLNYETLIVNNADHLTILHTLFNKNLIKWIKHIKNNEINNISFRIERMRHNKSNYIEVLNYDSDYGKIDVILNEEQINISIENITEFIFEIPSRYNINHTTLILECNGSKEIFNTNKKKVFFKKIDDKFVMNDKNLKYNTVDYGKGMGLLDVYMDKLKIIAQNDKCENGLYKLRNIVKTMSELKTMGYDPNVNVDYEVEYTDFINKDSIYNSNAILINEGKNKFFRRIMKYLPIKILQDGFYYNNEFIEGEYSILFICKNPYSDGKKLLIIYSSNNVLFNENYFLRNFILPSYSNGLNPWLNSEVLILKNKKYITIKKINDSIKFD